MFTQSRAIESFVSEAITWDRGPIALVASAAVCFVAGMAHEQTVKDITTAMREALETNGLKAATQYRNSALGLKLAQLLEGDGVLGIVTDERSPMLAQTAILDWLDKEHSIASVDALARKVGIYQRSPKQQTAESAEPPARAGRAAPAEEVEDADPLALQAELAKRTNDLDTAIAVRNIWEDRVLQLQRNAKQSARRHKQDGTKVHSIHG